MSDQITRLGITFSEDVTEEQAQQFLEELRRRVEKVGGTISYTEKMELHFYIDCCTAVHLSDGGDNLFTVNSLQRYMRENNIKTATVSDRTVTWDGKEE